MKIRNGFVSNSSSSSFIVAVKDEKNTEITVSNAVNLKKYTDSIIKTPEELLKILVKDYYLLEELLDPTTHAGKIYIKAKKAIEAGNIILMGSFSSESGDPIEAMLCETGLTKEDKNIIVIESEGGY